MPKISANASPKYRRHKATGQAIVTLSGRDHYLGPHGSAASHREYDRLITEWIANGRSARSIKADATVVELIAAYVSFARDHYRGSTELEKMRYALKPLKEIYGRIAAAEFSPLKLKAVRSRMIEAKLSRTEINRRIGRIKRFFAWAVENEHVPPNVLHGLQAVAGLAGGRSDAR